MSPASSRFKAFAFVALGMVLASAPSQAHQHRHRPHAYRVRFAGVETASAAPVIQCVAFAKQDAGIDISGNARDWWGRAAGIYERGSRPEAGSVLSFRENARMPLGHVAVVSGIEDSRTIVIDQSHWASRGITRNVVVKDVSDDNDWSAVRVQLAGGDGFGSIYPTHGFIYPRPDRDAVAPEVRYSTAIRRSGRSRRVHVATEVAEAAEAPRGLDLTIGGLSPDSLSRPLR